MTDTFLTRIPTLTEAELREYLDGHHRYRLEAIEAAAAELRKRGHEVPEHQLEGIRGRVQERDAAPPRVYRAGFLRDAGGPRLDRIRAITFAILAAGLVAAGVIYRRAASAAASPFDLEPQDSKSYLRQVEMMGGTANVLASQIRLWFTGLWHGTNLAYTLFCLCAGAAAVFWLVATQKGTAVKSS